MPSCTSLAALCLHFGSIMDLSNICMARQLTVRLSVGVSGAKSLTPISCATHDAVASRHLSARLYFFLPRIPALSREARHVG